MKTTLARLFQETLEEIAPEKRIAQSVQLHGQYLQVDNQRIDLDACNRIVIAALGKAAYPMTSAIVKLLAPRHVEGVAVGPDLTDKPNLGACACSHIETICGSHPYPDHRSANAANALLGSVQGLGKDDLVLFLLSGGGSSLAECPVHAGVLMDDIAELHRLLVTSGANIVDTNVVRKHFSGIKGGRLAAAATPAQQLTLYISDVPAAHPSAVASGPTMPDDSTIEDTRRVLKTLGLSDRLPASLQQQLETGLSETPARGDTAFDRSSWHCLLNNDMAVDVLARRAAKLGWVVHCDNSVDDWPVANAVNALLQRLKQLSVAHPGQTTCLLSGGELSSPVRGDGIGGRNQAFVLQAVPQIADTGISILSAGTDGIDGNSPAAGAFADGNSLHRALSAGLDPWEFDKRSDAYTFFTALGDAFVTGPTNNNVRDLRLLLNTPKS